MTSAAYGAPLAANQVEHHPMLDQTKVLAACREQPQRLDWARTRTVDVTAITREEINAFAAKYLRPERLVSYIVLPEPLPASPTAPSAAAQAPTAK